MSNPHVTVIINFTLRNHHFPQPWSLFFESKYTLLKQISMGFEI